ncbi:hypothetical protein D0Z07_5294 [Hyphodiscus hymeniophilus]|uniref:FAD dependent oxidoreductase domain-containing protein n=1 Tax=Hyphodiscus hymeniophilus TaxID=353542 RepID=A0A9P7AWK2_9HELO|nr:hypothetical protein D0Z07_5294 [Hyphodiscus hymeniophilus]
MGGGSDIFPVANSTHSYWRSELHDIDSHRSEEFPSECDVLIVGAGISGVSTAYHILDDNPSPPSVVLLEAREICSGATGRNGCGHLMMGWQFLNGMLKNYGADAAKELTLFKANQVFAMKEVVEKEKLDCDFVLTRVCETYLAQSEADEMTASYEELLKEGLDYIHDVQYLGPKYVERLSGIKGAKAATTVTAAQLWPYKFVTSLLAHLLETTSINVQTHTRVTSVSQCPDGSSLIRTPRGSICAKKVVFATNGYTPGIAHSYTDTIIPVKGTCSHIKTPADTQYPPPHLVQTFGLSFGGKEIRDYLIPRPDGGVICGGAKDTYVTDKELWWNNFDDSTLIEPARKHFETVMQDNFRGWDKSGAFVDYLWYVLETCKSSSCFIPASTTNPC